MKRDYDTKALIYTVLTMVILLCVLTLYIVYHDAGSDHLPGWLRWFLG